VRKICKDSWTVSRRLVFTCEQRRQVDFFEVCEIHHVNEHGRRAIQRRTPTCTRRCTRAAYTQKNIDPRQFFLVV